METRTRGFEAEVDRAICPSTVTVSTSPSASRSRRSVVASSPCANTRRAYGSSWRCIMCTIISVAQFIGVCSSAKTCEIGENLLCHLADYLALILVRSVSLSPDHVVPMTRHSRAASTTSRVTCDSALMSTRRTICVRSRCKSRKFPPVMRMMAANASASLKLCAGSVTPKDTPQSWRGSENETCKIPDESC